MPGSRRTRRHNNANGIQGVHHAKRSKSRAAQLGAGGQGSGRHHALLLADQNHGHHGGRNRRRLSGGGSASGPGRHQRGDDPFVHRCADGADARQPLRSLALLVDGDSHQRRGHLADRQSDRSVGRAAAGEHRPVCGGLAGDVCDLVGQRA